MIWAVIALAQGQALTPRQVLSSTEADDRAFITPDGRLMALADWSSGDVGLLDLATKKLHRLMAKPGQWESDDFASMPVPSPDLSQVAFLWYSGGRNPDLRVIPNHEGAKPRTLVHNPEFAYVLPQAWSSAGDSILVVLWKHDYTAQIAWVAAADGSIKVLRSLDWRRPGRISLSPDGRYVAYSCLTGPDSIDSHIYVLTADGSGESEVVKEAGVNESPVWTPDGTRLLFVSDRSASMDLWSIPVAAGKAAGPASRVQSKIGRITPLGLTRSGSLYYVKEHGTENVVVATLAAEGGKVSGQPFLLTDDFAGRNRGPAWSPDGRFVAFKRRSETNRAGYDLVVRALTTGEEKTYGNNSLSGSTSRPSWFPDGLGLLTAMTDNQNRTSIQRVDLKTGEFSEAVPGDPGFLPIQALSPDSKTVYIATRDDRKSTGGILGVDLRSGEQKPLFTTPGFVNNFALSPDGRTLAIARSVSHNGRWEGRLSLVPSASGPARDLYTSDEFSPGEDIFGGGPMIEWIPDGSEILFGAGAREWRVMRVPASGGPARFTGLVTTGLRHDAAVDPNADPQAPRIAFSDGKSSIKEAWVLEGLADHRDPTAGK